MERPYDVKYPGEAGAALRAVCEEFLDRIAAGNGAARSVGAG
jgi:hypothetical protein